MAIGDSNMLSKSNLDSVKKTEYNEYVIKLKTLLRYFKFLQEISEHCNEYSVSRLLLHYCNNQIKYKVKLRIVKNLIRSGYLKEYMKDSYKGNKPTFITKTLSGVKFFQKEEIEFEKLKKLIDKTLNQRFSLLLQ